MGKEDDLFYSQMGHNKGKLLETQSWRLENNFGGGVGAVGVGLGEYLKSSPFDTQLLNIGASLVAWQERILLQ